MALCLTPIISGDTIPSESTCIAFYFDRVYVGTNSGTLLQYQVSGDHKVVDTTKEPPIAAYTHHKNKEISQVEVIGELGYVYLLIDNAIIVLDSRNLEYQSSYSETFATDVSYPERIRYFRLNQRGPPNFEICVVRGSRLELYQITAGNVLHELWKKIQLESTPQDIAFDSFSICASLEEAFIMLDIRTEVVKEVYEKHNALQISKTDDNKSNSFTRTSSKVKAISGNRFLLLIGSLGVIIDSKGEPAGNTLIWDAAPALIAYSDPYIVSLSTEMQLEVHSTRSEDQQHTVMETIKVHSAVALEDSNLWNSLSTYNDTDSFDKGVQTQTLDTDSIKLTSGGRVLLLSLEPKITISRVESVSINQRINQLINVLKIDEAQGMLERSFKKFLTSENQRKVQMQEFHIKCACKMLKNKSIANGFAHFMKANMDPRELISYYENIQSEMFQYNPEILKISHEGTEQLDSIRAVRKEPFLQCKLLHLCFDKTSDSLEEKEKLLERAVELYLAMIEYLEGCRARLISHKEAEKYVRNQNLEEALDTSLLKAYLLFVNTPEETLIPDLKSKIEFHLSQENAVEDSPKIPQSLREHGLYHATALYFISKRLYREALEIWTDLGTGQIQEEGRDGVNETISFLSSHHNDQEIWVFSSWVIRKSPAQGIKIFTNAEASKNLTPVSVLQHLASFPDNRKNQLRLKYLEYLVSNNLWRESETELDENLPTTLAIEYVRTIQALFEHAGAFRVEHEPIEKEPPALTGRLKDDINAIRTRFRDFVLENEEFDIRRTLRTLDEALLGKLLIDEKVSLLAKAGRHSEALHIIVYEQNDLQMAEDYCVKEYRRVASNSFWRDLTDDASSHQARKGLDDNENSENNQLLEEDSDEDYSLGNEAQSKPKDLYMLNPFLHLLRIYFVPDKTTNDRTKEVFRTASIRLLVHFSSFLDPISVLNILPESLPLSQVQEYMSLIFSSQEHRKNRNRIAKHLASAHNLKVDYSLFQLKKSGIVIDSESVCNVCGDKIGTDPFETIIMESVRMGGYVRTKIAPKHISCGRLSAA